MLRDGFTPDTFRLITRSTNSFKKPLSAAAVQQPFWLYVKNLPEWNGDNTEGCVHRASDCCKSFLCLGWKYCMKTICIIVYTDYFFRSSFVRSIRCDCILIGWKNIFLLSHLFFSHCMATKPHCDTECFHSVFSFDARSSVADNTSTHKSMFCVYLCYSMCAFR